MLQSYEYKVVPAPTKGRKGPGIKGAEGRFAHGIEAAINMMAVDGWEYLRADTLPSEERQGLTSSQTVYRTVLVFRRVLNTETVATPSLPWHKSAAEMEPEPSAPAADATPDPDPMPEPAASQPAQNTDAPRPIPPKD